jgi:hypothetical protein
VSQFRPPHSAGNSLDKRPKVHNHPADPLIKEKKELITSLMRKAEDQQLSSTQNILTEVLASFTPEINVQLHKLESLARVTQWARAKLRLDLRNTLKPALQQSSNYLLVPTCLKGSHDESFVAYDGKTDNGARVIVFTTKRNFIHTSKLDSRRYVLCCPEAILSELFNSCCDRW